MRPSACLPCGRWRCSARARARRGPLCTRETVENPLRPPSCTTRPLHRNCLQPGAPSLKPLRIARSRTFGTRHTGCPWRAARPSAPRGCSHRGVVKAVRRARRRPYPPGGPAPLWPLPLPCPCALERSYTPHGCRGARCLMPWSSSRHQSYTPIKPGADHPPRARAAVRYRVRRGGAGVRDRRRVLGAAPEPGCADAPPLGLRREAGRHDRAACLSAAERDPVCG